MIVSISFLLLFEAICHVQLAGCAMNEELFPRIPETHIVPSRFLPFIISGGNCVVTSRHIFYLSPYPEYRISKRDSKRLRKCSTYDFVLIDWWASDLRPSTYLSFLFFFSVVNNRYSTDSVRRKERLYVASPNSETGNDMGNFYCKITDWFRNHEVEIDRLN